MSQPIGTKRNWRGQATLNAATVVPLRVAHSNLTTIFVTKITLSIITHAAGKLVQVQDSSGSPVVIAKHLDAAAGSGVPSSVTWDFGYQGEGDGTQGGIQLTTGKDCNAVSESGGVAGIVYAEGYEITPKV